jgi:nucleotide-binding universal stress UspA family protein
MKHIVVPIDFSEESINGLKLAIIFANQFKACLQMVYVQKPATEMGRLNLEEEHIKVEEAFAKVIKDYGSNFHDSSKFEFFIKRGKVYHEVVSQAEAFENSVIILSTHGASGFEELFIGSNALKIISASDLPVITIRHGAIAREISTIVLPIDITPDTRQKATLTATVAKAFNAEIHVLGVCSSSSSEAEIKVNAYTKQVCEYFKEHQVKHRFAIRTGKSILNTIIEYSAEVKADMISVMTEKSGSLSDFVLGTNAQQMISKSPIPVLNITPKEVSVKGSFSTSGG